MSASILSASRFSVPKGANGAAGDRFFSVLIRYVATQESESAEETPGIVVFSGNNLTVSKICSALVLEIFITPVVEYLPTRGNIKHMDKFSLLHDKEKDDGRTETNRPNRPPRYRRR